MHVQYISQKCYYRAQIRYYYVIGVVIAWWMEVLFPGTSGQDVIRRRFRAVSGRRFRPQVYNANTSQSYIKTVCNQRNYILLYTL